MKLENTSARNAVSEAVSFATKENNCQGYDSLIFCYMVKFIGADLLTSILQSQLVALPIPIARLAANTHFRPSHRWKDRLINLSDCPNPNSQLAVKVVLLLYLRSRYLNSSRTLLANGRLLLCESSALLRSIRLTSSFWYWCRGRSALTWVYQNY